MKKIIAAGGLVFNDAQQLLMIFRRGKWDLPKGKLEEDETLETCAVREVKEETGISEIKLESFLGITLHEYFDTYEKAEVLKETHWFVMNTNDHKLTPQTEEDIEKIEWVEPERLPYYFSESYKNIIEIIGSYYQKVEG